MSRELWAVWGMLGSLVVGYLLGRWACQEDADSWRQRSREWRRIADDAIDALARETGETEDQVAVDRLLREL